MYTAMRLSVAYVKVGNVRSPALVGWYNGHLHNLNGPSPGSVTSSHVTIFKVCVNDKDRNFTPKFFQVGRKSVWLIYIYGRLIWTWVREVSVTMTTTRGGV